MTDMQSPRTTPSETRTTRPPGPQFFTEQELQNVNTGLQTAYREIDRIATELNSDSTAVRTAADTLKQAQENEVFIGRNRTAVAASGLYASLRIHRQPVALAEIADQTDRTRRSIHRANSDLQETLGLPVPPAPATEYVPRFVEQLNDSISDEYTDTAIETTITMIEETDTADLSGYSPTGIAAAALYASALIHDISATQHEISTVTGVTEVTIRKRYPVFLDSADASEELPFSFNQ